VSAVSLALGRSWPNVISGRSLLVHVLEFLFGWNESSAFTFLLDTIQKLPSFRGALGVMIWKHKLPCRLAELHHPTAQFAFAWPKYLQLELAQLELKI
jgi:hypothetical protein